MVAWFAFGLGVIAVGLLVAGEIRRWREPTPAPQLDADQVSEIVASALAALDSRVRDDLNAAHDYAEGRVLLVREELRDLDTRFSGAAEMLERKVLERIDALELKPEPIELDDEQSMNLRTAWPLVVCPHCGTVHEGNCPRVREIRYQANGNMERIVYWPQGRWSPPRGSITAWDVYGAGGRPPPEPEGEEAAA
jgi:hypothetical protein